MGLPFDCSIGQIAVWDCSSSAICRIASSFSSSVNSSSFVSVSVVKVSVWVSLTSILSILSKIENCKFCGFGGCGFTVAGFVVATFFGAGLYSSPSMV